VGARVAVLRDVIPGGGVADVIDRNVVMLASEERDGGVAFAPTKHVPTRGLALPLGDHPVLDAQPLAAVLVGPAGDVACRENAGRAGFEIFIDDDAAIGKGRGASRCGASTSISFPCADT
jgi:hypothetical protein